MLYFCYCSGRTSVSPDARSDPGSGGMKGSMTERRTGNRGASGTEKRGTENSYPGSGYYRRKRRRDREKRKRRAVLAAAVLLAAVLAVIGMKKLIRGGAGTPSGSDQEQITVEAENTSQEETKLKSAVTVNDVDITGMSRDEAEKAILSKYHWSMTAKLENAGEKDETYAVSNLLNRKLAMVLDDVYDSGKTPKESYLLDAEGLDDEIAAESAAMAEKWNVAPKNGAVSGFDKESGQFQYTESRDGRTVDQSAAEDAIRTAMKEQDYSAELTIPASTEPAKLTAAQAKEKYTVIGTYTTKATANADRNNNLQLACSAIDGTILQPGETFSFNSATGNRTLERGYKPAGAYQNGKVVLEPGGGVCQVSSTLYNAVIKAGLTPTERHAHTFEPSYVTPGEDATVSYDGYAGPDMRFVNTTESSLAIRATFYDRTVTVSLIGLPVLEEGVTISLHSVKTEEYDNGGVEYVDDTTLQPGVEKVISEGTKGSRWVTNIITKKNGEVVSDVFFHNSTYKGHAKKIARNPGTSVTSTTGADEMTIVENTETAAEQAENSSTEAATVAPNTSGGAEGSSGTASPTKTPETSAEKTAAPGTTAAAASTAATAAKTESPGTTASSAASAGPGTEAAQTSSAAETAETIAPFPGN